MTKTAKHPYQAQLTQTTYHDVSTLSTAEQNSNKALVANTGQRQNIALGNTQSAHAQFIRKDTFNNEIWRIDDEKFLGNPLSPKDTPIYAIRRPDLMAKFWLISSEQLGLETLIPLNPNADIQRQMIQYNTLQQLAFISQHIPLNNIPYLTQNIARIYGVSNDNDGIYQSDVQTIKQGLEIVTNAMNPIKGAIDTFIQTYTIQKQTLNAHKQRYARLRSLPESLAVYDGYDAVIKQTEQHIQNWNGLERNLLDFKANVAQLTQYCHHLNQHMQTLSPNDTATFGQVKTLLAPLKQKLDTFFTGHIQLYKNMYTELGDSLPYITGLDYSQAIPTLDIGINNALKTHSSTHAQNTALLQAWHNALDTTATQLENAIPCWFWFDTLMHVQGNRTSYDNTYGYTKNITALPRQKTLLTQTERRAIPQAIADKITQSGLAHFYQDAHGDHRIIIPFNHQTGDTHTHEWAEFTIDTTTPVESWIKSPESLHAIATGKPMVYPDPQTGEHRIVVYMPVRGLVLLHANESFVQTVTAKIQAFLTTDNKQITPFNWNNQRYYAGADIQGVNGTLSPAEYILESDTTDGSIQQYVLLDARTGESVAGEQSAEQGWVFRGLDTANPTAYQTAQAYNAQIKRTDSDSGVACITDDGHLTTPLKFAYRTEIGTEIWHGTDGAGLIFNRSANGGRFTQTQFLNPPLSDKWVGKKTFYGTAQWNNVVNAIKKTPQTGLMIEWEDDHGTLYTSGITPTNNAIVGGLKHALSYIETLDTVAPLHYTDGSWFVLDPTTSHPKSTTPYQWSQDTLQFVADAGVKPHYETKIYTASTPWKTVSNSVQNGQNITEWTAPNGTVYTTQRRDSTNTLNTHRLLNIPTDKGSQSVTAIQYHHGQWHKVNPKTGQVIAGETWLYDSISDSLYTPTPTGQAVTAYDSTTPWETVSNSVQNGQNTTEWTAPDGLVYSTQKQAYFPRARRLITVYESGTPTVCAIEYTGFQYACVIDPKTGNPMAGLFVKNDDGGAYTFFINKTVAQAVIQSRTTKKQDDQQELITPARGAWLGRIVFTHQDTWAKVANAVRQQRQTAKFVEWQSPDGTVYTSRRFKNTTNGHILTTVPNGTDVFALKQIGATDWVAINTQTGDLDHRHTTTQNANGTLRPMVDMHQQASDFAHFVMPNDGALGLDSPTNETSQKTSSMALKNRITQALNKARQSGEQEYKFHTTDHAYIIANVLGTDALAPARSGVQVMQSPYDEFGQTTERYRLIDPTTALPIMENNHPVYAVRGGDDRLMTGAYFNRKVDKKTTQNHIATNEGEIIKAHFVRTDNTGAEIWVRTAPDSTHPLITENQLTYLRRSTDGTTFTPFRQSLSNQDLVDSTDLQHIIIEPIDTGATLTDWNAVLQHLATHKKPLFKTTVNGTETTFHSQNNTTYDHRILKLHHNTQSEYGLAKRIFGDLWYEINPLTGHYTGSLIQTDPHSGTYIRQNHPLESLWKHSVSGVPQLNTPIDYKIFSRHGVQQGDMPFVRTYVSGIKFTPTASTAGHHDYLQGILQIANPIDMGITTKTMFPVVTYGTAQGLSQSRSFVRGFGGRLINPEWLVYAYQNLDNPLMVDGDNSKTLRQHLQSRYGHKLPVQNLILMLSAGAEYYEKSGQAGKLPTIARVDMHAPSLAKIHKTIANWGGYTNSDFAVSGIDKPSTSAVVSNRRAVFLTYNKAEQQIILYHGLRNRNTGTSAQGEAGEFTSGAVLSRLMGVKSTTVLSNPNLPGKRTALDSLRRMLGTEDSGQNVQIRINDQSPIVLRVELHDQSQHLIVIKDGSVRMANVGMVFNPHAQILGSGLTDPNFATIDTYSYDGAFIGTQYSPTGVTNPMLLLDNGDRLAVAPLLLPAPPATTAGQVQQGLAYMTRKVLLDGLLGIGTHKIVGNNSVSWLVDKALTVARKVLIIHYGSALLDYTRQDGEIRLGAFGDISPDDGHFWGGITAMVAVQEMLTSAFNTIGHNVPDVLVSRDRFMTHYALSALGYSAQQYARLQTNFMIQKIAGFPRGNWDSATEWGVPLLSSIVHGALETFKHHQPSINGADFQNGAVTMAQFLVDSISRGTLNATATNNAVWTDIMGRAIMERTIGRSFDRVLLPSLQELIQQEIINKKIGTTDPLINQYRLTYAQENPAGDWATTAKRAIAQFDERLVQKWNDHTRTTEWIPVRRLQSLWNSSMLFKSGVWRLVSYLSSASMQASHYKTISNAILQRDLGYAQRPHDGSATPTTAYETFKNAGDDVTGKPHMNWDTNLPPQFREWITHQSWRPDLFAVQAGADFVQRLASAYAGEIQSGRIPQELGTFSTAFQVVIRDISKEMRKQATLESDLKRLQDTGQITLQTRNNIRKAMNQYTVESNVYHYLLRYDQTGTTKPTQIVDGIGFNSQVMTDGQTTRGNPNHIISPMHVLAANFLALKTKKYDSILYRGVNTMVGYAPNTLGNANAGENPQNQIKQGDIITNTEMFSTSQSEWLAQSFGTGIDQAQLRTDARQKIVILGKTSINVTELSDLNQAEAIFTPGTIFQIEKTEGSTHGNDIGNVVYVKQINTFDWERNYYYLQNRMYDKLVYTAGQSLPIAMHPITGITYQITTYQDGDTTKHNAYFMPVKNYFLGWGLSQRDGELATWYRPFDAPTTPQGMRDGIYTAWVEQDTFAKSHLKQSVRNVHHDYFRNQYQTTNPTEGADINQFRTTLATAKKSGASTATARLTDPHMLGGQSPISIKQQEKLIIWQMANVLRRKVTLFALNRNGDGRFIAQKFPQFVVDTAYDGVALSAVGNPTAYPPITIGVYEDNGHRTYYVHTNANTIHPTPNAVSGTRWFKSDFGTTNTHISNRKFATGTMESLTHAIHVGANGQGYGVSNPTDGTTLNTFDTVAGNRYGALVDKMRHLAQFNYDAYQYALSAFYNALMQDETLTHIPTPKVLAENTLPAQYQRKTMTQTPLSKAPKTFGTGDGAVTITGVVQDALNRLWLQTGDAENRQYIPITVYEGFDSTNPTPNTLVFQNQDPTAERQQRFYIWERTTQTLANSPFAPAHIPTLKPVVGDPSGDMLIDGNHNLFLPINGGNTPVREMTGFRHLKDPKTKTYAMLDLSDTTGNTAHVWIQSTPTTGTWQTLNYRGNRPKTEFGDTVTYYDFTERLSDSQIKLWQYRTHEQDGNRWHKKVIQAGDSPIRIGQDIIYTTTNDGGRKVLTTTPLQKPTNSAFVPPTLSHSIMGQITVGGLTIYVQATHAYGTPIKFLVMQDNQPWHIDRIHSNGAVEISSTDGTQQATLNTQNPSTILQGQNSGASITNPQRHALLIKADFNGKTTGRYLLEIAPNAYMFVTVLSQSEQSHRIIALDPATNKLIDFNRRTYQWATCPVPAQSAGKYALRSYWTTGADSLAYWNPTQSAWQANPVHAYWQGGKYDYKTIIGSQELTVGNTAQSPNATLTWQGKTVGALDTSGVPFDTQNQMIWLDNDDAFYTLKRQRNDFTITPLSTTSMRDFVVQFYGILGVQTTADSPMVTKTLAKIKPSTINTITQGNTLLRVLRAIASNNSVANALLHRIAIQLHSPDTIATIKVHHTPTQAVLHVMHNSNGGLSYWHWGSKNFALPHGQYYSQPATPDQIPTTTGQYEDKVANLVDGYYNTVLLSAPTQTGDKWILNMVNFAPITAEKLYTSPDGSKTVWVPVPRNGALLIGDGVRMTIAKRTPKNAMGMQNMVALDLGDKLAYWAVNNTPSQWALIPTQTQPDGTRTVTISNHALTLHSTPQYGTAVSLKIDGKPITGMDSFGGLQTKNKAYHDFGTTLSSVRENIDFYIGTASGRGNNCLIHAIILATNDPVHSPYNAGFVETTANRIRANMITQMQAMHATDSTVQVIGKTEQIDVADPHQITALVTALRNDQHVGLFQPTDTLIIHARNGLEYQATLPTHTENSRAVHLWYTGTGYDGHFAPILSTNQRYGFYTYYNPTTGAYDTPPAPDGRLGVHSGILTTLPAQAWDKPNLADLTKLIHSGTGDSGLGYARHYILQLNGDDAVYKSSYNLFSKHPKHTDWLQIQNGKITDSFGWNPHTNTMESVNTFPADGGKGIRVTLVGHTITGADGTRRFADLTLADVQHALNTLLSQFNKGDMTTLRISLLGCQLAQPQYKPTQTIPGKLAQWLMDNHGDYGIAQNAITITAREYAVRVNPAGKKEILTPNGQWIVKEDARLWDTIHKYVFAWDTPSQSVVMKMPDTSTTHAIGVEIEHALQSKTLTTTEKRHLADLHAQVIALIRQQLFDTPQPPAQHRTAVEHTTALLVGSIDQALTWLEKIKALKAQNHLGTEWLPLWNVPNADTPKIQFINKQTGESRWVPANDPIFAQFSKNMENKLKDFKNGVTYDRSKHTIAPKTDISDADAVNTLNAAFFFQTILELANGENATEKNYGELATVMKIQTYVQLTQDTFGIIEDTANLIQLLAQAGKFNSKMFGKVIGVFSRVSMGINVALDVVNIVTSAVALHHSKTPAEKAIYGTQLGIAIVSSGVSFAGIIAGFAGAVTTSAVLGALAVPLAGIGFAIPFLVGSLLQNQHKFDEVVKLFDRILDTVSNPGVHQKDGVWSITSGASVADINFKTGQYTYATVTTDSLTGGSNKTRCKYKGHYWYTYATNSPRIGDPIDVYKGFGVSNTQNFDAKDVDIFVLPYEPSCHYKLTYTAYSGDERGEKPNALGKLHKYYEDRFQWGYYQTVNHAITNVQQQVHYQSLTVTLDNKNRTLILPSVSDDTLRSHLHYNIHCDAGQYQVMLADHPSWLDIYGDSTTGKATLTIVCDQALKNVTVKDNKLHIGNFKDGIFNTIKYQNNTLTIGSQKIGIHDKFKKIMLECTLDNNSPVRVIITVDTTDGTLTPVVYIPNVPINLSPCINPARDRYFSVLWESMHHDYVNDVLKFANVLDGISAYGTLDVFANLQGKTYNTIGQVIKKQHTTATGKDQFALVLSKITIPQNKLLCLWQYTRLESHPIPAQTIADWQGQQSYVRGYVVGNRMVLAIKMGDSRYMDELDDKKKPTGNMVLQENKSINFVYNQQSNTLVRYPMQWTRQNVNFSHYALPKNPSQWGLMAMAELGAKTVFVQDGDLPDTRLSPALSTLTVALATDVTQIRLSTTACDVPRVAIIGLANTTHTVTIKLDKYTQGDFTTNRDGGDLILNHKTTQNQIRLTNGLTHSTESRVSVEFADGTTASLLTLMAQ